MGSCVCVFVCVRARALFFCCCIHETFLFGRELGGISLSPLLFFRFFFSSFHDFSLCFPVSRSASYRGALKAENACEQKNIQRKRERECVRVSVCLYKTIVAKRIMSEPVHMDTIERSKENIQPIARGRNAGKLVQAVKDFESHPGVLLGENLEMQRSFVYLCIFFF